MLAAKQKRKENIIEYILYLFQVEDLIRALKLDIELIEKQLVAQYKADELTTNEISAWYKNLVVMMEKEGIRKKGHLQFLKNLINDLNEIHLKLIETEIDSKYISTFQTTAGLVTELKQKNSLAENDIEVSLDAIYGFLLLKMQQKPVTEETTEAIKRISAWLNNLSVLYHKYEADELDFDKEPELQ